ncbi:hypothetical protein [Pseudohaliea sp.]|uniref:hypothetical protein n=1 Tax=Pseudohaliea sp. TaxID=2740289 RepID=UPI0032EAA2C9
MLAGLRNALVAFLGHKRPLPAFPLSDFERLQAEIQPGDVILVEGRSRVSDVIGWVTQSPWTHAALYLGPAASLAEAPELTTRLATTPEEPLLIESELGQGTVLRPLSAYRGEHLRVCRPRGLGPGARRKVLRYALGRLGTPYDVRQIFDLLRFLFPWFIMPRRWRSTLFEAAAGPGTHTVCSTMIAEAFASAGHPILPLVKRVEDGHLVLYRRNPKLCVPADFDYSPYFSIVKYPVLDLRSWDREELAEGTAAAALGAEEQGLYLPEPLRSIAEARPPPDTQ